MQETNQPTQFRNTLMQPSGESDTPKIQQNTGVIGSTIVEEPYS